MNPKLYEANDKARVFKGAIPDPDAFVTYDDVEKVLNFGHCDYVEIIHPDTGTKIVSMPKQQLMDLIERGSTFIISGYARYNKTTNELCRTVEQNFGVRSDIHLYGGTDLGKHNSFGIHCDLSANFICQVYGETEWTVYKERSGVRYEFPKQELQLTEDDLGLTVDLEVTLKRGDVLYIPFRAFHRAKPQGQRLSMSLPMWYQEQDIDRNFYEVKRWK